MTVDEILSKNNATIYDCIFFTHDELILKMNIHILLLVRGESAPDSLRGAKLLKRNENHELHISPFLRRLSTRRGKRRDSNWWRGDEREAMQGKGEKWLGMKWVSEGVKKSNKTKRKKRVAMGRGAESMAR